MNPLAWVEINRGNYFYRALWLTASLLIFSGVIDILIDMDVRETGGENISDIVGIATRVGFIAFVSIVVVSRIVGWLGRSDADPMSSRSEADQAGEQVLIHSLERLLAETSLHLDPNLNLKQGRQKSWHSRPRNLPGYQPAAGPKLLAIY